MNGIKKIDEAIRRTVDILIEKDYLDRSKFEEIKLFSDVLKGKVYEILARPAVTTDKMNRPSVSEPLLIPLQKVLENNTANFTLGFIIHRDYQTLDLVNLQLNNGRNLYKNFQDVDIYRLPTAAKAYETLKQSKASLSNKIRQIMDKHSGRNSSLKR